MERSGHNEIYERLTRSPNGTFNPGPFEYEQVITIRPRRPVGAYYSK